MYKANDNHIKMIWCLNMYINYDYYRVFYYVAKYGNFTQAAEFLLGNQPNITRTIKNLENELGCTLFIRSNRGVRLTPEGEKLYAHVSVAVEQILVGEEELSQNKSLQSGVVSIGASEVALHCCLLPILKQFHRDYPGIRIRISNHTTPQAITALSRGLVDLAVITTPFEIKDPLKSVELKPFSEIAVCGTSLQHLTGAPVHLFELCQYPLICLSPQTKTYEFYSQFFAKHGLHLSPDVEAATADQLLPMIKNDLGIGFLPEELAAAAMEAGEIFQIHLHEEIPKRAICMLKNTDKPMSIAAKAVEGAIRNPK